MDLVSIIIYFVLIYVVYTLVTTISSLREEIQEMRQKCIKNVYKDDTSHLTKSTDDPKQVLKGAFDNMMNYIRN